MSVSVKEVLRRRGGRVAGRLGSFRTLGEGIPRRWGSFRRLGEEYQGDGGALGDWERE